MTQPKITTVSRGGSRFYVHPESDEKVPGVTSVVGMLPKPFLTYWAAKVVAQTAVDNLGSVVSLAMNDPVGCVDYLKRAPGRDTDKAAQTGTDAHDLFERLANGEDIGRVHPDLQPYVDHFNAFLTEFKPTFLHLEQTVWSETHRYAGSFDGIFQIGEEIVLADWKTTRSGVHEEVALQLAAYAHADYILSPDGTQEPLPAITGGAVLHVRPEGWALVPIRIDDEVFEHFITLRKTFDWDKAVKQTVLGNPINAGAAKKRGRR